MISSIDTNILLDVLLPDVTHLPSSKALLDLHVTHIHEGAWVRKLYHPELLCISDKAGDTLLAKQRGARPRRDTRTTLALLSLGPPALGVPAFWPL